MDNAELKARHVADAERAVEAARRHVNKLEAHLAGAHEGVEVALAELDRVKATDYVWEEPQEHVIARPQ